MDDKIWQAILHASPTADLGSAAVALDRIQVERFYLPIARRFLEAAASPQRRLIGIAGPPGSGKSTFAAILGAAVNALHGQEIAVVVGQDGWHYPNAYLVAHTIDLTGQTVPLRQIKGAPPTFDADRLAAFLARVRQEARIAFPVYSRERHEPIPDAGTVLPAHRIVLVEGNYLLLRQAPWQAIARRFDETIFLTAPEAELRDGLRSRHLRGGKPAEIIEKHLREVDLPNVRLVLSASLSPDILVEKRDRRTIVRVSGRLEISHTE